MLEHPTAGFSGQKPMSKSDRAGLQSSGTTDDSTTPEITGPHLASDARDGVYEYYQCEQCGLESADPAMDETGCPRCTTGEA
jgi:hypothetical protein